ncbi:Pectin lyase-like superfamily protein isoform 1 [Hibiscus syriacus]|uniref:Pectin lyase-like superfamily protein isoform 1 n=1 Tax=Hibiscus syriacus TaxID=106335 RepID=A0A6A2Z1U8_HIBSY|nr:Pectin lyase-like superfamily protein isoform 1 [Hibiscus syriacus]
MSVSGLTGCPSRCCLRLPDNNQGLVVCRQVFAIPTAGKPNEKFGNLRLARNRWTASIRRWKMQKTHLVKCAMDASYGDSASESGGSAIFPRINVRDPYKRLGISKEASEDEIQGRDKQIPNSSHQGHCKNIISILVLGVLTVLFPTEEGPTLQVAISLLATFYFIHDRLKSKIRALLYGAGAFIFSWLMGTFLMVSVIPPIPIPILKGPRSFEVLTSLITYVLLWVSSTYLK